MYIGWVMGDTPPPPKKTLYPHQDLIVKCDNILPDFYQTDLFKQFVAFTQTLEHRSIRTQRNNLNNIKKHPTMNKELKPTVLNILLTDTVPVGYF